MGLRMERAQGNTRQCKTRLLFCLVLFPNKPNSYQPTDTSPGESSHLRAPGLQTLLSTLRAFLRGPRLHQHLRTAASSVRAHQPASQAGFILGAPLQLRLSGGGNSPRSF